MLNDNHSLFNFQTSNKRPAHGFFPVDTSVKKGSNTLLFYFYRKEDGEKLEDNKRHLMNITQKVFNAIVESAHSYVLCRNLLRILRRFLLLFLEDKLKRKNVLYFGRQKHRKCDQQHFLT